MMCLTLMDTLLLAVCRCPSACQLFGMDCSRRWAFGAWHQFVIHCRLQVSTKKTAMLVFWQQTWPFQTAQPLRHRQAIAGGQSIQTP